jgi:hypothetical protein
MGPKGGALASGLSVAPNLTVNSTSELWGRQFWPAAGGFVVAEDCPIMGLGSFGKQAFLGHGKTFDAWELTLQVHSM